MRIITNNKPRDTLGGFELTDRERAEFDHIADVDECFMRFFRYRGACYDLHEFLLWDNPDSPTLGVWDGFRSDSYFSGLVVRYVDDCERVVVGLALS